MWVCKIFDNYSVVYPEDEWHRHDKVVWENGETVKSDCPCGTRIEWEGKHPIIVHGSFNGREGVEEANGILKNE